MNRPSIVFINGLPATGKTTIGKQISDALMVPFFSKDTVKELLFDALGWSDREWSKKVGTAALKLLDYLVEEELRAGRSIVLESNFKPQYDNGRFQMLQRTYGYAAVQILCSAPGEVLFDRFMQRAQTDRHPGHADAHNADEWRQTLLTQKSEPLAITGAIIHVDTTDFSRLDVSAVIQEVRTALLHVGEA